MRRAAGGRRSRPTLAGNFCVPFLGRPLKLTEPVTQTSRVTGSGTLASARLNNLLRGLANRTELEPRVCTHALTKEPCAPQTDDPVAVRRPQCAERDVPRVPKVVYMPCSAQLLLNCTNAIVAHIGSTSISLIYIDTWVGYSNVYTDVRCIYTAGPCHLVPARNLETVQRRVQGERDACRHRSW